MFASMTYEAANKKVVLFGGTRGEGGVLGDTWTWDGCRWTQATPATSPPARSGGAMAYASSPRNVVLFGGGTANVDPTRTDTWTWDGTTWKEEHPATSPSRMVEMLMADDPNNGNVVLFGFGGPNLQTPMTWTWDGSGWTDRHPSTSPPARTNGAMVTGAHSGVLLHGGSSGETGALNDSWAWDGKTWSQLHPSTNPPGGPSSMAHEDSRHDVVLVEGGATWTWSGSNWTQQRPSTNPPFEYFRSIAYDAARDRVVMFGGKDAKTNQGANDTWLWDGTNWSAAGAS